MKTKPITIIDAIRDAKLFRSWFRDRKSWSAWEVFLKAMFGLPLKADELELYTQCTRRDEPPTTPAKEVWAIVGTSETSAQQANALIACATQREARFGGSLFSYALTRRSLRLPFNAQKYFRRGDYE